MTTPVNKDEFIGKLNAYRITPNDLVKEDAGKTRTSLHKDTGNAPVSCEASTSVSAKAVPAPHKKIRKQIPTIDSSDTGYSGAEEPAERKAPAQVAVTINRKRKSDMNDFQQVPVPIKNFQTGQWILVKYASKKKHLFYVGQILAVPGETRELEVTFARRQSGRSTGSLFKFPDVEDFDNVSFDDVQEIIKSSAMNNRHC